MAKAGIVAFAFGVPANIRSNNLIAQIAANKALSLKAPVFTHLDIQFSKSDYGVIDVERIKEEEPDYPPSTLQIARAAVDWARQRGIRELWIVAAVPHVWRCERDLKYAVSGVNASIKIQVCGEIKRHKDDLWFDPKSFQPRTRSSSKWWRREIILRILPMFLYERLTD